MVRRAHAHRGLPTRHAGRPGGDLRPGHRRGAACIDHALTGTGDTDRRSRVEHDRGADGRTAVGDEAALAAREADTDAGDAENRARARGDGVDVDGERHADRVVRRDRAERVRRRSRRTGGRHDAAWERLAAPSHQD